MQNLLAILVRPNSQLILSWAPGWKLNLGCNNSEHHSDESKTGILTRGSSEIHHEKQTAITSPYGLSSAKTRMKSFLERWLAKTEATPLES